MVFSKKKILLKEWILFLIYMDQFNDAKIIYSIENLKYDKLNDS